MKINFSNFVKLFLAGASLLAVGCTDYGQDIQNLRDDMNDRFDALQTDTIDPLRADLTQVQKDLAAAQEAIQAQQLKHDEDVKALQNADAALQKAIDDAAKKAADDLAALATELRGADAQLATDLANLSTELKDSIAKTNEKVAANEQAIADAIAKAEKELADLNAQLTKAIADGDAALKADLEKQIAAVQSNLTSEIARVDGAIAKNADAITALTKALADAQTALEKAIADGDAKLAADLAQAVSDLTAIIEGHVADLQKQIDAINTEIAGLKSVDAGLQDQINDLVTALAATDAKVATNAENIAANADAIAKNADNINHNADAIKALDAALASHIAEFTLFQTTVNSQIAALQQDVLDLKAEDARLAGEIARLDDLHNQQQELINKNIEDIQKNAQALEDYKAEVAEIVKGIEDAHNALAEKVEGYYDELLGKIADNAAKIGEAEKELEKQLGLIDANKAAIEANKTAIAKNAADITALDERLTALEAAHATLESEHNALKAAYETFKANVEESIEGIKEVNGQQDLKIQANTDLINKSVAELNETIETVKKALEAAIAALDEKLQKQIDALVGDVEELKARLQSIVYVPEYTDGMATIEYAKFGNKIIECNSVMTYQVHPANCAAIFNKPEAKDYLSFLFQGLKTRAAVAENVQLEVVGVKVTNAAKGYIAVTVQAHNLGDNFYNGQAVNNDYSHYAVSLVFNNKVNNVENNIASCYTTLIAEKAEDAAVISMGILDNEGKEIFDPQAQPVVSHEIIYSDLETKKEFMPGNYPVFKLGNGKWFTYEQIVSAGYQISQPQQTITYAYFDKEGKETNTFESVYNNVEAGEGYKYVTTNLAEVQKLAVKSYETVTYTYATDGTEVSTTGKLTITKDKGTFNLGEATVAWARNLDNNVTVFSRDNIGYVLAEKVLAGKSTSYAEAVAGTLTTLTVNGADILANAWDLTDDKMSAELVKVAADAEPVLKFEGFEWNKTYTFKAIYELDNIDVTINFAVKTVLPKYTINLEEMVITWNYAQDWKSTFGSENTNRELTVVVKDSKAEYTENAVPAYADVIKNGVQNSLTAPDPIYELLENVIKCSKFEWNKSYAFAAEYALADALVTINGSVKTVKADRKTTITLPESTLAMKKDMVVDDTHNAINDVLATAFTEENVADLCLGATTVQDYLSAIFADASLPVVTVDVEKFVAVDANKDQHVTTYSDPSIQYTTEIRVAADGQSMNTYYNYKDVNVIPDLVVYTMTVTTWDEAVITFVKNVKFELPIYDYRHVLQWVYENDKKTGSFYSNALVSYDNDKVPGTDTGLVPFLQGCNVHLDMDTAFKVINTNTGDVIDDLGAEGLVSTFHFTANPNSDVLDAANPNIKFLRPLNMLQYHGKAESVAVKATLKFKNSDGTAERVLKTSFDEGYAQDASYDYTKYIVRPVDPIGILKKTNLNIYVDTKAKTYTYYIGNLLELKDDRGFDLLAPGYLKEDNDNEVTWTQFSTVVGNLATDESNVSDSNGFKLNTDAATVYGITSIEFTCAGIPEDLAKKNQMRFNESTGELYFDNTNQIELTDDIPLKITAKVDYIWDVQTVDIEVWFKKKQ